MLKGLADQSRAKNFPVQTVADTLSRAPDPMLAAAGPCLNLISDAAIHEDRAFALRAQAASNPALGSRADQETAAAQRALDQFNNCFDHNVITAPLAPMTLAGLAKKLAPHYDLSNPGDVGRLGTDIIGGYALNQGLKYLLPAIPSAVRFVFGKTGEPLPPATTLPAPVQQWLSPAAGAPQPTWLPPGAMNSPRPPNVAVPDVLKRTPRPVYPQEQANTCVPACIRMAAETILRRNVPEAVVTRALPPGAFDPGVGTFMEGIAAGFKNLGVPARLVNNATVDDIATAVKNGYPAIVRVGDASDGHGILVDGVMGQPGNRYFFIRDPLNLSLLDPSYREVLEVAGFRSAPVVTENDFVSVFETTPGSKAGRAVLTSP